MIAALIILILLIVLIIILCVLWAKFKPIIDDLTKAHSEYTKIKSVVTKVKDYYDSVGGFSGLRSLLQDEQVKDYFNRMLSSLKNMKSRWMSTCGSLLGDIDFMKREEVKRVVEKWKKGFERLHHHIQDHLKIDVSNLRADLELIWSAILEEVANFKVVVTDAINNEVLAAVDDGIGLGFTDGKKTGNALPDTC